MSMSLIPFIVLWGILALSVIAMIVWRQALGRQEDDTLHVLHGEALPHQAAVAHKLDVIEKWGKTLTIITVIFGILIALLFVYQTWVQTSTTVLG